MSVNEEETAQRFSNAVFSRVMEFDAAATKLLSETSESPSLHIATAFSVGLELIKMGMQFTPAETEGPNEFFELGHQLISAGIEALKKKS